MKHILCSTFGHQYKITKHITDYVKEYECARCKNRATINSLGHLIKLTKKRKDINSTLEDFFKKRKEKKKELSHYH